MLYKSHVSNFLLIFDPLGCTKIIATTEEDNNAEKKQKKLLMMERQQTGTTIGALWHEATNNAVVPDMEE